MVRRRALLGTLFGLSVAAAFAACGFPDVAFNDNPLDGSTAETSDAPVDATGSDAAEVADTSAPPQQDVDPEGGAQDAETRDAGTVIDRDAGPDAQSCGALLGTYCDCDQDQALKDGGPTACAAPAQATPDCDDFDPLVRPGSDFVQATWDPTSPHLPANDWNCDGNVVKQFNYNVTCTLLNCTQGFKTDVGCGEVGTYNVCKPGLNALGIAITCSVDHSFDLTQGCR